MAMAHTKRTSDKAPVPVGSAEFKARCLELVERVKEARAEYTITRHGVPVARLVPVDVDQPGSLVGSMAGTVVQYDSPFEPIPAAWSLDAPDEA